MTKGKILGDIYDALPESRRRDIKARAAKKIEAIRGLQELRKLAGFTQNDLAGQLGLPQSNISRLEKNSDMLLSTLRNYVEAVGGTLQLTVELPDCQPIKLTKVGDESEETHVLITSMCLCNLLTFSL